MTFNAGHLAVVDSRLQFGPVESECAQTVARGAHQVRRLVLQLKLRL